MVGRTPMGFSMHFLAIGSAQSVLTNASAQWRASMRHGSLAQRFADTVR